MSYDYLLFRSIHRLTSRREINKDIIIPFVSKDAILIFLRKAYPETQVDSGGTGWLKPAENAGAITLPNEDASIFHLAHIPRSEVQALCTSLGLTALDLHTMELILPQQDGSSALQAE